MLLAFVSTWKGHKLTTKLGGTLKDQAHTTLSSLQLLPIPWRGTTSGDQRDTEGHSGTATVGTGSSSQRSREVSLPHQPFPWRPSSREVDLRLGVESDVTC